MRTVHRLVLVLSFWGGLLMLMLLAAGAPGPTPGKEIWLILVPGIIAAIIIYPIAWIAASPR